MRKYLFSTLPSNDLGLLTRSLPIARALDKRGDQVVFCSPGKIPSRSIASAGFDNLQPRWAPYTILTGNTSFLNSCRAALGGHLLRDIRIMRSFVSQLQTSTADIWGVDDFMNMLGMGNVRYIRRTVDTLVRLIGDTDPDAVVDFWNPCMCMAARIARKPLISVLQSDIHPQSKGFLWWRETPAGLPSIMPAVNTIRTEYGLPPAEKAGDLLIGDRTLVLGSPKTDPLPETADVTYIGPILWQRENAALPDLGLNDMVPVIWLYGGNLKYIPRSQSPFDSIAIVRACMIALRNMPVQIVLSSGHQSLPGELLPLPFNFLHTGYVPGLAMAQRCDLMIHHGGYGSCQTGLFTGTPSLIIPTFSERESNARRIAALGAGEYILPGPGGEKRFDPIEIRGTVEHMLSDKSYKRQAQSIGEHLREYGGARQTAELIDAFMTELNGKQEQRHAVTG